MAERYTKLFSLEDNLYCEGAPLIIRGGRLLRDGYTGKLLAQLKFQNISCKTITTAELRLTTVDSAGRLAEDPVVHRYLDLNVPRDSDFGQKSAVVIPGADIQYFTAVVTEVIFDDGSSWTLDNRPWKALKEHKLLADEFQDEELATQYRIRYGTDCKFAPVEDAELWFCTCGAVNHLDERSCHNCRRVYSALKDVNISSLKSECAERLENEKEQQAQDDIDAKEKRKNLRSLVLALIPVFIVIALVCVFVPREIKNHERYENAQALVDSGQYDKAAEAFDSLGNYKDSSTQSESNIPYERNLELMRYAETANPVGLKLIDVNQSSLSEDDDISIIMYQAAADRFKELGDYKDSAELSEKCLKAIEDIKTAKLQAKYDDAAALLADKQFCLARDAFVELGSFKDSASMAKEAIYQKAMQLFGFMSQQNIRNVWVKLSTETDVPGIISFSKDFALSNGEGYITEFKAACGKDKVDFVLEDQPSEGLVPFQDALTELFKSLGDYKESSDYIPQITRLCDYTREFYELVEKGDVYGAYDWLSAYEYEFEDRDYWLNLLEMYKPYCGYWVLNTGDRSLIPYIAGDSNNGTNVCTGFTTSVIIGDGTATLKLDTDDGKYTLNFTTELGNAKGFSSSIPPFNYFVNISVLNKLAIMKYNSAGNILSSCDYSPS